MAFITAAAADKNSYDVIVVGSGAAGGQTAYTLTMEGARVLMLEAGRNYDPATETPMMQTSGDAPLRGAGTPDKPFGFWDATIDGGWQVPGEPYTSASDDPARQFVWWRARMLGGRTNHWGRISLRNGAYDFKPYSRDGLGFDWPVGYADVAPYYDKVEMLIGVYGSNEGLENTPDSSPGVLLPPPKPRVSDLLIQQRARKLGIPVIAGHRAVLTKPLDHQRLPRLLHPGNRKAQAIIAADMQKRAACFFATPCGRGCSIRANYQSTTVHLPPALDTGNLDIVTDAMVRAVTKKADGRAEGVVYIDRKTGMEHRVKARIVVLAASALESVRILLNSDAANSSGKVGKYIMDTVGANFSGQVPLLENMPLHNEDGVDGLHLYTPWWLYKEQIAGKLGFARGYHFEFGGGRSMPNMGTGANLDWLTGGTYGKKFKEDARRYYGSFVGFAGRGEMIPNDDCFAELDPKVKDRFGIPVLRFHWKWSEHEIGQAAHMQKTAAEIIDAMGGRYATAPQSGEKAIKQGGLIIHEVGGAIMGSDPKKSVTNSFGQCWDMKNLFITDGATLCSNADKNPTLTIMALAWRASDEMLRQMKRKEL
ncbi:MAG: GMC family oxidoreductase [Steroidobacteraceae bacterium]|nr:GMC family oxidoreductase [Steroidobacteraceae bacterium]